MNGVSVIIPTRNRSALLHSTLRSVQRQRDVDIEVVVVDDASTDDTVDVFAAIVDERLHLVRNTAAMGPNAARNRGAAEVRSDWLAFVDDDDLWAPEKLVQQIRAAEESGRDWVYGGSVNINDDLEIIHGVPPPPPSEVMAALSRYNAIPASASNVVVRRSVFVELGGFNEDLRSCEEWDLWLRLARRGTPAWVPRPLVAYRMHSGSASLDVNAVLAGARRLEQLHDVQIDWGRFHWWVAQLCVRSGRRAEALRQYALAARGGRMKEAGADLTALLSQFVQRRVGRSLPAPARHSDAAWEDQARNWLEELRRLDSGSSGDPR
jgi:glycosyltransferase involved in cell wall biosynthesis